MGPAAHVQTVVLLAAVQKHCHPKVQYVLLQQKVISEFYFYGARVRAPSLILFLSVSHLPSKGVDTQKG